VSWERDAPDDGELRLVRPYAMTAGRTRASGVHLAMEAVIVTQPGVAEEGLRYEARLIVSMCVAPLSVAEIAARLNVPVGTARVLIGDLVQDGLVAVHDGQVDRGGRPDVALLERVLDGLQAL
jgi:hypothetical protein